MEYIIDGSEDPVKIRGKTVETEGIQVDKIEDPDLVKSEGD